MAARRPQLTLEELQQLKWLLGGVLTLLAISTVFYMDVEAWSLLAITGVVTLATLLRPTLPARVPSLAHTLAFPAIVAFFAADLWLKTEVLPAMVRLDILLLLYRNISYRQRRDDLQIVVLGLFLIVVAGVLTVSLVFAVQILVYTACALALLLVVTLSDAAIGPGPRGPVPFGETPGWAQHANWRHLARRFRDVIDWRVAGLGLALFAGVVAVSAFLFLAIPRFQLENSMFLDRFISKKTKSGFSDVIRFGDVTEIQLDDSVALSVDVADQDQIPASPYWRMLVLDVYETGTFRLSRGLSGAEFGNERSAAILPGIASQRRGDPRQWTFFLESGVSRYMPLLGHFQTLQFREVQNVRFAPRVGLVALREQPASMTAYRVEGFDLAPSLADPAFAAKWAKRGAPPHRRVELQAWVPAFPYEQDFATLNRVLQDVTGGAELSAGEFAQRAGDWLKKNHNYSLSPNIAKGSGDPLVRWMASRNGGHCELFAGSLVLLARAAGFPARVVTGFRGGTWNGYSNSFTVRNADAHAWGEIFDEKSGAWLRADPLAAAASTEVDSVQAGAMTARTDRSWKARLDSLRVFWYRRIVNFDQRSQIETMKAVKDATQSSGKLLREALTEMVSSAKAWLTAPWDVRRLVTLATGVLGVAAVIWLWRGFGRDWWRGLRRASGTQRENPVRREASHWLARLHDAGTRNVDTSAVVADLQRLRFANQATWPETERVFQRARHAWREARRQRPATPISSRR
jgi:protein-glutamine gamma-glutamyltransferase